MIVLCLAGLGKRFTDVGVYKPKYLLPWKSKLNLLSTIIKELKIPKDLMVMLILNDRHKEYYDEVILAIEKIHKNYCLHYIEDTLGQAETAKIAAEISISKFPEYSSRPVIFLNGDTILKNRDINEYQYSLKKTDGLIDTFSNTNANYSYIKYSDDTVTAIEEKLVISDHATTGLYGFKNPVYYLENYLSTNFKGEHYISYVYDTLLSHNARIKDRHVKNVKDTIIVGTPEEYQSHMGDECLKYLKK